MESSIKLTADVKAIRRARELCKVSRQELASRLGINHKTIEKMENGRMRLSQQRCEDILKVLGLNSADLARIKKGKGLRRPKRKVIVTSNAQRRSYKKMVTKECKVLRSLRKQKGISQDRASFLCGYSRPTIGHIENGRIELSKERIKHIVKCYGFTYLEFEVDLNKEVLRDEILEFCIDKMRCLDDSKLEVVKGLLGSL